MQQNNALMVNLKFILITEEITFIPDNIINCCEIINVSRPTKTAYNKCIKKNIAANYKIETITNIKNLDIVADELMQPYKFICDKIIDSMLNVDDIKFLKFRDLQYDIFIYNLNISDCIWYILSTLIQNKHINPKDVSNVLMRTYTFFQYYNNNYRPIYHLENYLFNLVALIHNY